MLSVFDVLDTNLISYIFTGEFAPTISVVYITPDISNNSSGILNFFSRKETNDNNLEYDEFVTYIDYLQQFCNNIIANHNNVIYTLRPFMEFVKFQYVSGINNYRADICIPFNYKNYIKLRKYCEYLENGNYDFVHELLNRRFNSLKSYVDNLQEIEYLNSGDVINNQYVYDIMCQNNNQLVSDIMLIYVDCSKSDDTSFIYKSGFLKYVEVQSLLSFYSGFIVSTYDIYGTKSRYLIIGTGIYDSQISSFIGQKLVPISIQTLDSIYVSDACALTADSIINKTGFFFRINCGATLYNMFLKNVNINLSTLSKKKSKDKSIKGKILKLIKHNRILDIICKINDSKQKNWYIQQRDGNFTLNVTYGSLILSLETLQFQFNFLGNLFSGMSTKNFYQYYFINYNKELFLDNNNAIGSEVLNNLENALQHYENYKFAFPNSLGAVADNIDSLFYYSYNKLNLDDSATGSYMKINDISASLLSRLFVPFSYLKLFFVYGCNFLKESICSGISKSTGKDIAGSYYTVDFNSDFYNIDWKNANNFLKCNNFVTEIVNLYKNNPFKINTIFSNLIDTSINLPIISYCKSFANSDKVLFVANKNNYSVCFYSFTDEVNIFLDSVIRTFDIRFSLQKLSYIFNSVFILSNEIIGPYIGVHTSKYFYIRNGYKYSVLLSNMYDVRSEYSNFLAFLFSFTKNLNSLLNLNSNSICNELNISMSTSLLDYDYTNKKYIIPRFEMSYHNDNTIIDPIFSFSTGVSRLYELLRMKSNGISNNSFYINNKEGFEPCYIYSICSLSHSNIINKELLSFKYFNIKGMLDVEYGIATSLPLHSHPKLNFFSHIKCNFMLSQTYILQIVFSLLSNPRLVSDIVTYKIKDNLFFNVSLNMKLNS